MAIAISITFLAATAISILILTAIAQCKSHTTLTASQLLIATANHSKFSSATAKEIIRNMTMVMTHLHLRLRQNLILMITTKITITTTSSRRANLMDSKLATTRMLKMRAAVPSKSRAVIIKTIA